MTSCNICIVIQHVPHLELNTSRIKYQKIVDVSEDLLDYVLRNNNL